MFKSPGNEFLLHKCGNKNEKIIFFFKSEKYVLVQLTKK